MIKFISNGVSIEDQMFPTVEITLDSEATRSDVLAAFETFLRAAGFSFDGTIEIVAEDEHVRPDYDSARVSTLPEDCTPF